VCTQLCTPQPLSTGYLHTTELGAGPRREKPPQTANASDQEGYHNRLRSLIARSVSVARVTPGCGTRALETIQLFLEAKHPKVMTGGTPLQPTLNTTWGAMAIACELGEPH
jgi:hypothetical protein